MGNSLTIIRRMGLLIFIGLILIVYAALGIIYVQEVDEQRNLEEQSNKIKLVISKPLPSIEELKAEYDKVNLSLSPLAVPDTLEILVGIAKESGINVNPDAGKFNIKAISTHKSFKPEKVGEGNYQVVSLRHIKVQGDYDRVMTFISNLDAGKTLETMVLKKTEFSQLEINYTGEEKARRTELRDVIAAVAAMMTGNNLNTIPFPIKYTGGTATNHMGDNPDTEETIEGFPDITTTADEKGYTGNSAPKNGYVLYEHDKISTDNTSQFGSVNYINVLTTKYYYTCEGDGAVRQFDRPDLATAIEYRGIELTKIETAAIVEVDTYSKSSKG